MVNFEGDFVDFATQRNGCRGREKDLLPQTGTTLTLSLTVDIHGTTFSVHASPLPESNTCTYHSIKNTPVLVQHSLGNTLHASVSTTF
jgi:hypothetical protein